MTSGDKHDEDNSHFFDLETSERSFEQSSLWIPQVLLLSGEWSSTVHCPPVDVGLDDYGPKPSLPYYLYPIRFGSHLANAPPTAFTIATPILFAIRNLRPAF